MPEYYPDIAFLANLFLDYILLGIAARGRGLKIKQVRQWAAAASGSVLSVILTVAGSTGMGLSAGKLCGAAAMCLIAFGRRGAGKNILALFGCTFVMGGMLYAAAAVTGGNAGGAGHVIIPASFVLAALTMISAGGIILFRKLHRKNIGKPVYPVRFCIGDVSYRCSGFLDTGNGLYDPFRKKPVLLLVAPEFKLPLQELCKKQPEKTRYIPYRAVGTQEGMLCGAELETVTIEAGQEEIQLFAVPAAYASVSGQGCAYQVILHPDFFENIA